MKTPKVKNGKNYTSVDIGPMGELNGYILHHPKMGERPGKVFLKEHLGSTGVEMSLGSLAVGAGIPFLHKHKKNEEIYFIVSGKGQIQIDGDVTEVSEGSVIRISPDGSRSLRNTGAAPLVYAVFQATQGSLSQWTATDGILVEDAVQWPA